MKYYQNILQKHQHQRLIGLSNMNKWNYYYKSWNVSSTTVRLFQSLQQHQAKYHDNINNNSSNYNYENTLVSMLQQQREHSSNLCAVRIMLKQL